MKARILVAVRPKVQVNPPDLLDEKFRAADEYMRTHRIERRVPAEPEPELDDGQVSTLLQEQAG